MKKSTSFDVDFFIMESGIRTELLRALMAMKQKSVASEEPSTFFKKGAGWGRRNPTPSARTK
jgi:hypothetical protein